GVAVRILRRDDWAEEGLQDCFVSIWSHAGSYSPGLSAPMTWMTSIVRNRCLHWLRRPKGEVVLQREDEDAEDPIESVPTAHPGPPDQLAGRAAAKAFADCLGRLEVKQRQAIMLAFYDGLSHSELASHMRQPLGTVKTWVRRGLERLKACLGSN